MEVLQKEIYDHTSDSAQESFRNQQYQRSSMQRSAIVDRLRREGCRITKQRKIILDIILQEECTCCNEKLCKIIEKGMESCGYLQSRRVRRVSVENSN